MIQKQSLLKQSKARFRIWARFRIMLRTIFSKMNFFFVLRSETKKDLTKNKQQTSEETQRFLFFKEVVTIHVALYCLEINNIIASPDGNGRSKHPLKGELQRE
jgi:hypothetical protein